MTMIETQRKELVGALTDLYGHGDWVRPNRSSDGRGGYTSTTISRDVLLHREQTREETVRRNISPGNALIYVLNTGDEVHPLKGDALTYDGEAYRVVGVAQDPIGVAYECECERSHSIAA